MVPPRSIWLDQLPADTRRAIAVHITEGKPTTEALYLARVSSGMCESVISSFDNMFNIDTSNENLAEWLTLSTNHVTNLRCVIPDFNPTSPRAETACQLLKSPLVTSATISDIHPILQSIHSATSIRSLAVRVTSTVSIFTLLDVLRSLSLTSLKLYCAEEERICRLDYLWCLARPAQLLANACPWLEFLDIDCDHFDCPPLPFHDIVQAFPHLKQVTVRRLVTMTSILPLHQIRNVRIHIGGALQNCQCEFNGTDVWDHPVENLSIHVAGLLRGLGERVTSLRCAKYLSQACISQLRHCPRIQELELVVNKNSFHELAKVAPFISDLKVLRLHGKRGNVEENSGNEEAGISTLVKHLTRLEELIIPCLMISGIKLKEVVQIRGETLRKLSVPVNGPSQVCTEHLSRLNIVVEEICSICTGLEHFALVHSIGTRNRFIARRRAQDTVAIDPEECEGVKRLVASLRILQRRGVIMSTPCVGRICTLISDP